ncbi:helix-turn-helix domain-containing protein [Nonomuraea sp. LPB2021202275-12-8]|uniref:helix-turn-helix domain-containing protein n=1 Tax=Nonomuraea sp. LPB2021202275-12-8 TaxID=3120159 RepID=UPI00300CC3C9
MADNELGKYLRSRREATKPDDVGLPGSPRRRTPGLRRSELATLAGVSVEYLTRLEQGRDRNPSAQVAGALADALRLGPEERLHLHHLIKINSGDFLLCAAAAELPDHAIRPSVRALLERLEPAPAVLLNRMSDVLAHTSGYDRLARPLGLLDGDSPNLIRFLFADPRARAAYPDWERLADEHATALNQAAALADERAVNFAHELTITAGAAFSDRSPVSFGPRTSARPEHLVHPEAGELRLIPETLEVAQAEQRLIVYLPADQVTAAALDRLTGRRPGALRAVNG